MIIDSTFLSTVIIALRDLKGQPNLCNRKGYVYGHVTVSIWTFEMKNMRIIWKFASAMGENASVWVTQEAKDEVKCYFWMRIWIFSCRFFTY